MKNNKTHTLFISGLTILFCANYSQESVEHESEPSVNCQGTLIDNKGNSFNVKNILISGLYEKVPVYLIPGAQTTNPSVETKELNLRDVNKITFPYPDDPTLGIKPFNDREYVEIHILFNNGKERNYLVERYRELWLWEKGGPSGKMKIKFEALRNLTIDRCEHRKIQDQKNEDDNNEIEKSTSSTLAHVKDGMMNFYTNVKSSVKNLFA